VETCRTAARVLCVVQSETAARVLCVVQSETAARVFVLCRVRLSPEDSSLPDDGH